MSGFADMFGLAAAKLGQVVTLWQPNETINATMGMDDAAWVNGGTVTSIINELAPDKSEILTGGPIDTKMATLYLSETDGAIANVNDLIVTASGNVWVIAGRPSQPAPGGHFEARLTYEVHPPAEVLP